MNRFPLPRFPYRALGLLLLGILVLAEGLPGASGRDGSGPADGQTWIIRVEAGTEAREVAAQLGALYRGSLRGVDGYHRIRFLENLESRSGEPLERVIARQLESTPAVEVFEQERTLERYPRSFAPADPRFAEQWHLENAGQSGGLPFADIRVRPVWDAGISGAGVTIATVDEGTQFRHPDLEPNWVIGSGYDYNDDDTDPSPSGSDDRHGTAVAGISLAASNRVGGLGVAYDSRLVPLRLIAGPYQSGEEAEALSYRRQEVAIYNNSWGPSDEAGVRYADSSRVLKDALAMNVREGRGGRGNIYVWAAGNGGLNGDNSNYDGYNASPFTISVGAVGHDDIKTGYSEPGANLLVVAPSGGRGAGILTTDNTGASGYAFGDYYDNFSGTSAATPIVSGVVALLLERRPDLGWRDVQQILALSASPVDFDPALWSRNGAGHWYSHDYGFGRVDAAAALQLAETWLLLGPEQTLELTDGLIGTPIRLPDNQTVRRTLTAAEAIEVQHAEITVRLNHDDWGELRIELVSPSGTRSTLSEPHNNANSSGEPGLWTYLSTHFLGESSLGEWTLEVTDEAGGSNGSLRSWRLLLRGSHADSPANQPPLAEDLFIETTRFPVEVDTFDGVSDPEGGPVRMVSFQRPRHGTLTDLGDGRFRFSMGESKDGTDMFSVLLADDRGRVTRRMVQVLDPRPVGRNDLFPVSAGDELALPVLRNDLDPDGDPLRLTGLQANITGTAEMQADGTIRYRSPQGFSGVERIEYSLTDDSDGDSIGWATVIVQEDPEVALEFDGEDDYLILEPTPDLNTTDRFTAEAWIYPEDWGEYVTGFGRIFDRDTFIFFLNGFDHSLYADQSLVVYLILDDGSAVAANTVGGVIELDRWQHVAVSYDSTAPGSTVAIYVDGEPVDHSYPLDNTSTPRRPLFNNAGRPLFMGEAPSGARAFKGRMTDFRIWDRVLDAQTVRARHDVRLDGSEPGLSLYFPLDRRLDPVAESAGSLPLTADIFEARRIPLELPWEDLESRYVMVEDSGSGWWRERHLGWIHGDRFPWVFLPGMDWIFTGHGAGENRYRFYRPLSGWGWLQSQPDLFPWIFHHQTGKWLWYLEGTDSPGWFQTESGQWFSGESAVPGN